MPGSAARTREALGGAAERRLVAAAKKARDRVDRLTDDALEDLLREMLATRGALLDRIANPATPFDEAHRGALVHAIDEVMDDFDVRAQAIFGTRSPDLAALIRRLNEKEQGIARVRLPFDLRIPVDAVVVAQTELVGLEIVRVSDNFRAQVGADLRRTLTAGLDVRDFLNRTAAGLNDPGPFGTLATRAETIYRTEFGRTLEVARDVQRDALDRVGVKYRKRWIATKDARTRPDHLALDGTLAEWNEDLGEWGWYVGDEWAAYPLDPRLSVGQSANCRCTVVHEIEEVPEDLAGATAPAA